MSENSSRGVARGRSARRPRGRGPREAPRRSLRWRAWAAGLLTVVWVHFGAGLAGNGYAGAPSLVPDASSKAGGAASALVVVEEADDSVIPSEQGLAATAAGEVDPAVADSVWEGGPEVIPGDANSYQRAAVAAYEAGQLEIATSYLDEALQLRPDFSEAELSLARVEASQGQLESARERLGRIAQLENVWAGRAHKELGLMYGRQRMSLEASEHFRQAAALLPGDVEARLNLGVSLHGQGRSEEALPFLEAAQVLKPEGELVLLHLGRVLSELDRMDEAMACFLRLHEINPERPNATYQMARVKARIGRKEEARALYDKAAKLAAEHQNAQLVFRIKLEMNNL